MTIGVCSIGLGLILLASLLFLVTWALLIRQPKYLLGTITMLWFKILAKIIVAGLILLVLGEANQLLTTFLLWRR